MQDLYLFGECPQLILFTERSMACHMSQLHTMGYNFSSFDGASQEAWVSVDKLLSARMYYVAGLVCPRLAALPKVNGVVACPERNNTCGHCLQGEYKK
jgi:hypothetical protein